MGIGRDSGGEMEEQKMNWVPWLLLPLLWFLVSMLTLAFVAGFTDPKMDRFSKEMLAIPASFMLPIGWSMVIFLTAATIWL